MQRDERTKETQNNCREQYDDKPSDDLLKRVHLITQLPSTYAEYAQSLITSQITHIRNEMYYPNQIFPRDSYQFYMALNLLNAYRNILDIP